MIASEVAEFVEAHTPGDDARRHLNALIVRLVLQARDAGAAGRGADVNAWLAPLTGHTTTAPAPRGAEASWPRESPTHAALPPTPEVTQTPGYTLDESVFSDVLSAQSVVAIELQPLAGPELALDGALDLGARYQDLGLLGVGGMGEVRRVFDRDLGRSVAMKIIQADLSSDAASLVRFIEEAQVGAQLQHPGLIPVHEVGRLPDGRAYFTM